MSHDTPPPQDQGRIVHEVLWSEALPWWLLFRAAGAAFAPTVVLLALLGGLATWAGWSIADSLRLSGSDPAIDAILDARGGGGPDLAGPSGSGVASALAPSRDALPALRAAWTWLPKPAADVLELVVIPFRPTSSLRQMGGALARIAWFVLVWSIFGTAITRHVALKLVGEEAPGILGGVLYGARKWVAGFNSVAFVLLGIVALSVPGALLGLLMRSEWGLAVAGALWPLVLAGAVVLAILAIGLVVGWPLMVAAIGVERGDSFQAISTAFSYVYQRPLHYAFYAFVALVVALPACAAAGLLADATSTLALWAASFGMGHERTIAVLDGLRDAPDGSWGIRALAFWTGGLRTLLGSFGWGYFWSIATAAYVLLRHDVDGTELDEVVIEEPGT
ncbi:MAG: hypothetical protein EBR28_03515 [Planctomycetia bacterium]|nr:hypothetical protein [Planctomycetia bacterium]